MIIPTGYAQVNYVFSGPALPRGAQVTHGVQLVSGSPLVTPSDVAVFAATNWASTLGGQQISGVTLKEVRVKFGPNATGGDAVASPNTQGALNATGEAPQVAVLLRKRSAQGGRSGRGRMFVPGAPESQVQDGNLNTGAMAAWTQEAGDFLQGWNTQQTPVVILHSVSTAGPVIVTSMGAEQVVATQRRRIRKVGGRRSLVP